MGAVGAQIPQRQRRLSSVKASGKERRLYSKRSASLG